MSKRNKIILIVSIIIVVAVILYFYLRPKKVAVQVTETINGAPVTKTIKVEPTDSFPFSKGAAGSNVKMLQKALNIIQPSGMVKEDGVFGPETEAKLNITVTHELSKQPLTIEQFNTIIKMANL